jgi:acyl-CoA thioesterase
MGRPEQQAGSTVTHPSAVEAQRIAETVRDGMFTQDNASKGLGMAVESVGPGTARIGMTVRADMLNGFAIAHGGITYSLADSALAFASNAHGIQAVSIETSISHVKKVEAGDRLRTKVEEKSLTSKTGLYYITVTNQNDEVVAYFKGTVFRTGKVWEV